MKEDTKRICIYNRKDMLFSGVYEFKTINGVRTTRKVVGYGASEKTKPMGLLEYVKELKKEEKMNNIETKPEVAIYGRLAYKDDKGIIQQEKAVLDYCNEKGYKVYKSYIDNGFSGNNKTRPSLNLMLEDLKKGKFTKIVILKLDKLSRNMSHLVALEEEIRKYNCDIESVLDNFDTSTANDKSIMNILDIFAQMEKELIKDRIINGIKKNLQKSKE